MSEIKYTNHARKQMLARDISWPTIEAVALCGDVLEEQADGVRKRGACGIVVVLDDNLVVTVYRDDAHQPRYQRSRKPRGRKEFKPRYLRGKMVNVDLANYYLRMADR